jgi:hypothetical protein
MQKQVWASMIWMMPRRVPSAAARRPKKLNVAMAVTISGTISGRLMVM